jgi:hypothetical protein
MDPRHPLVNFSTQFYEKPTCPNTLGLLFPCDLTWGMPGTVTLTGLGAREGIVVKMSFFNWQPLPELGVIVGQLDVVPPGQWRITVETARGAVSALATVSEYGGVAKFAVPKFGGTASPSRL